MPTMNFEKYLCPSVMAFVTQAKENMNLIDVQMKTKIMYSQISKVSKTLEQKGIINKNRKGRQIQIEFTPKGERFKTHITEALKIWSNK